jgi:penicillin-binding protein 2
LEKRVIIAAYLTCFIFLLLFLRLWDLQVVKGREYKKIAESNRLRIVEIPAPRGLIYDRDHNPLVKNIPSFDISVVKEDLLKEPGTLSALGRLIDLSPEEIRSRLHTTSINPLLPVKLKQDVTFEEVARVEARKMDFPGLQVDTVISREYKYEGLASHAIGYLGRLTLEQSKDPEYVDVPRRAFIGQMGAEKVYDRILRGVAGKKFIEVDAMGRVIRVAGVQPPVKGDDIQLTIDLNIQREAEIAIAGRAGSVVTMDVHSGEILALVSMPSFNPNLFARGIKYRDWNRLVGDPLKPFLNRSIQSQYPPGSTFKPIVAIAALEKGIITGNTKFTCNGSINVGRVFRCWQSKGHGAIKMHRAIVESCDVYFYEIGKRMDIDTLAHYASLFGLGRVTGVELDGEVPGIVPSKDWKQGAKKEKWFLGETINVVIGQGYLSATPIQMARLTAALVNGGKLLRPRLLKDSNTEGIVESVAKVRPRTMALIKKALRGVVKDKKGTGHLARSDIVSIGGKTGTSQVVGSRDKSEIISDRFKDHAWFISFAPEKKPEIAVAVFVEHGGHGSTSAAPIAKKVIEAYAKKKDSRIQGVKDSSELLKAND